MGMLPANLPGPGRFALSPLLTPAGKLYGDLTVARLADDRYMLFGSYAVQNMHRRWFETHLPAEGVSYRNVTDDFHGLAIAGPKSRDVLRRLVRDDVSSEAFRFMDIRPMIVGNVPTLVARVSFTGELGYEIYCAPAHQLRLFEAIEEAYVFAARGLVETRAWRDLELISRTFVAEWPKSDKRPRLDLCAALAQIGQGAADKGLAGLKSRADSETYEDVKGDAAYYAGLATLQANPQNQQAALAWFEKSVKVFPREAACLDAARAAMKLEQWAKAREYADRAVREFPKGNPAVIDDARRLLPTVLKELAKQK